MMNDQKEEMIKNLTNREIVDDYNNHKPIKIVILVIVILSALIFIIIKNTNHKKTTKRVEYKICKYDDCNTFSKEFISNIRYSNIILSDRDNNGNCGINNNDIDTKLNTCANSKNKYCSEFESSKQYCYAFTKENLILEDRLELNNPVSLNELSYFSNLKNLYINIDKKETDVSNIINKLGELKENNLSELVSYIYIDSINDINVDKFLLNSDNYENINICIGSKELCSTANVYLTPVELKTIVDTFKKMKNQLYSLKQNPSDLEKIIFAYNYIIDNVNIDKLEGENLAIFTKDNYADIFKPQTIQGAIINKSATNSGFSIYFKNALDYLDIDSIIMKGVKVSTNNEYSWVRVKIDNNWYNTDIVLDAMNKKSGKYHFSYLLLNDDEYSLKSTIYVEGKIDTLSKTFDKSLINKTLTDLNLNK